MNISLSSLSIVGNNKGNLKFYEVERFGDVLFKWWPEVTADPEDQFFIKLNE